MKSVAFGELTPVTHKRLACLFTGQRAAQAAPVTPFADKELRSLAGRPARPPANRESTRRRLSPAALRLSALALAAGLTATFRLDRQPRHFEHRPWLDAAMPLAGTACLVTRMLGFRH